MGRPRRQELRRAHLVAATQRVLARDGLVGLRVREVAVEAGMSPASVHYYFPDSSELAVQALEHFLRTAASERAAVAASIPDPGRRLLALIDLDIPDRWPGIRRALCEIPSQVKAHPELARLIEFLVDEQVAVYRTALQELLPGSQARTVDADLAARCLVAGLRGVDFYRSCGLETAAGARRRTLATLQGVLGRRLVPAQSGRESADAIAATGGTP